MPEANHLCFSCHSHANPLNFFNLPGSCIRPDHVLLFAASLHIAVSARLGHWHACIKSCATPCPLESHTKVGLRLRITLFSRLAIAHRRFLLILRCAFPVSVDSFRQAGLRSGTGMKEERCKNRAKRSSSHPSIWCLFRILIEKLNLRFQFAGLEHCRLKYVPLNYAFGVIAVSTGGIIHKIRFALFNSAV